jgi:hypothetical protein
MFGDFPLRFFDLGLLGLELNGDGQVAFLGTMWFKWQNRWILRFSYQTWKFFFQAQGLQRKQT